MAGRKTHYLYRYEDGVGVPYCGTKGTNLHVTASLEVVNCAKCNNAIDIHIAAERRAQERLQ